MKRAAFFDIDGTLVSCQTQRVLTRVMREEKLLTPLQTLQILSWFFIYKLGLIRQSIELRRKFYRVLASRPKEAIDEIFFRAVSRIKESFICREMKAIVNNHRKEGDLLFAISASLSNLCLPICEEFEIEKCYATRLSCENGRYTGVWEGEILEGQKKVHLMHQLAAKYRFNLSDCTGYADSFSDLQMLLAVGTPVVVSPDCRLKKYALRQCWKVV